MTIAEFLLTRIADTEEWGANPPGRVADYVLAECEAKRRILAEIGRG